ncbi:hypothetical protein SMALA_1392 [Streptomyces malaysiensis subsp. malaysiensis]|nr:hypothetical protein SMALA_1392 [Streptomyces malaysiensis]
MLMFVEGFAESVSSVDCQVGIRMPVVTTLRPASVMRASKAAVNFEPDAVGPAVGAGVRGSRRPFLCRSSAGGVGTPGRWSRRDGPDAAARQTMMPPGPCAGDDTWANVEENRRSVIRLPTCVDDLPAPAPLSSRVPLPGDQPAVARQQRRRQLFEDLSPA